MSDSDLTTLLREHVCRYWGPASSDDESSCECGWWGEDWAAHVASVLSGVYAITPLPDVERAVQLYHEVTPNADTSGWATHHGSYDTVYSSVGEHTWTRAECDLDADAELIAAAVNLVASIARAQETPQ